MQKNELINSPKLMPKVKHLNIIKILLFAQNKNKLDILIIQNSSKYLMIIDHTAIANSCFFSVNWNCAQTYYSMLLIQSRWTLYWDWFAIGQTIKCRPHNTEHQLFLVLVEARCLQCVSEYSTHFDIMQTGHHNEINKSKHTNELSEK